MRTTTIALSGFIAFGALISSCGEMSGQKVKLTTDKDSASYAAGAAIAFNIKNDFEKQGVDSLLDGKIIAAAMYDVLVGDKQQLTEEQANETIRAFFAKLDESKAGQAKEKQTAFLNENKGKPGVVTTASGLQYIMIKEGSGKQPTAESQVKVHYRGKLLNGNEFDSSYERNEPVTFGLNQVIPGWTEALQLMKEGSQMKAFIPSELGYGERGGPPGSGIGPHELLVFDIELIEIVK